MVARPDRRSILLGAAAIALAALTPDQAGTARSSGVAGSPPQAEVSLGGAETGSPAPGTGARDTARPPVLTRADVEQKFSARAPGYWGLEAPGVLSRLPATAGSVALTLDFCGGNGGSGADLALLSALQQQRVPATLFLNSRWVNANQSLTRDLALDPLFEIANHGTSHKPLSVTGKSAYGIPGTRNTGEVYDEIMISDARLADLTGRRPRFFRPGTAFMDDVAVEIVRALGIIPVGFSVNGDGGATFPAATVTREVSRARAGDVVICHGNHPGGGTTPGLVRALAAMKDRGETFVHFPGTTG
ncbi:polysaccharide deacetylase family protein [Arthrobacter sp. 92]|uniref:polysaccharide deacetylase family protein n=1 Tax=Arthrobacter sp. 92 TaxID=3418175 RepID=UPI003D068B1B